MKISIITITYNSAASIVDCISSITHQTHNNFEYLIIDGASNDDTLFRIENTPNRITKIISEPDKGIYDALNKGIQLANGEIIGFLHSDDFFASSEILEKIDILFSTENEKSGKMIDVVYGDLVFVDRYDINKTVRYWKSQVFDLKLLKNGWMPPHPTVFMKKEVYKKHGLFNTNLSCAADYDYILRVFSDKSLTFCYMPEIITKMRIGGISTKGFKNLLTKMKEDLWVLKQNNMPLPLWVLIRKNISKLPQMILRK